MSLGQDDGSNATVKLWVDGSHLYVEYLAFNDWLISETHFAIATTKEGIPHGKKNMKPGHFPYGENYDPWVSACTLDIPWPDGLEGEWNGEDSLFVAAHAVFWKYINGEWVTETGWGGEKQYKIPALPDHCVWMDVDRAGWPRCFYWVDLSEVGTGPWDPYIWDGEWPSWCADKTKGITIYDEFDVKLFSMFDQDKPGFPAYAPFNDPDWPKIGWLLNNWQEYTNPEILSGTVQDVIWYLLGYQLKPTYEPGQTLATDADLHGGWLPSEGEVVPVFMIPCEANVKQPLFIEVDP
jgi:hypothetical protein